MRKIVLFSSLQQWMTIRLKQVRSEKRELNGISVDSTIRGYQVPFEESFCCSVFKVPNAKMNITGQTGETKKERNWVYFHSICILNRSSISMFNTKLLPLQNGVNGIIGQIFGCCSYLTGRNHRLCVHRYPDKINDLLCLQINSMMIRKPENISLLFRASV